MNLYIFIFLYFYIFLKINGYKGVLLYNSRKKDFS